MDTVLVKINNNKGTSKNYLFYKSAL
jgi:hypothetical protein